MLDPSRKRQGSTQPSMYKTGPSRKRQSSTQPSMCKTGPSRKRQSSTQPAKSMKRLKNSPWNAAPPHYETLPRCVHTQRLELSTISLPKVTETPNNKLSPLDQTPISPPCWQGTHQGTSPYLDAPPRNMPWSAMHACLKASRYRTRAFARVETAQHMRVHIQRQCMEKLIRIYLHRSWASICYL